MDEEVDVLLAQIRSIATSLERIADSFDALLDEIYEDREDDE
jgi:phage terminase Nu1 subunit (DNA packaging protein)